MLILVLWLQLHLMSPCSHLVLRVCFSICPRLLPNSCMYDLFLYTPFSFISATRTQHRWDSSSFPLCCQQNKPHNLVTMTKNISHLNISVCCCVTEYFLWTNHTGQMSVTFTTKYIYSLD